MSISDIDANTRGLGAFLKEKSVENCNHARPGREPGFGSTQTMTLPGTQTTLPLVTRMFL